jgi:DNA-directed RNA polymerase I, II, and III subunit RPABC2
MPPKKKEPVKAIEKNTEIEEGEDDELNSELEETSENEEEEQEDEEVDDDDLSEESDTDSNFENMDEITQFKNPNKCSQENYEEKNGNDEFNLRELEDDEEILIGSTKAINYEKDSKISKPYLTKYERTRLLGIRTSQLMQGAKPMVKNCSGLSSQKIAYLELKNKTMPLLIYRPIPNAKDEVWNIADLEFEFDSEDEFE